MNIFESGIINMYKHRATWYFLIKEVMTFSHIKSNPTFVTATILVKLHRYNLYSFSFKRVFSFCKLEKILSIF